MLGHQQGTEISHTNQMPWTEPRWQHFILYFLFYFISHFIMANVTSDGYQTKRANRERAHHFCCSGEGLLLHLGHHHFFNKGEDRGCLSPCKPQAVLCLWASTPRMNISSVFKCSRASEKNSGLSKSPCSCLSWIATGSALLHLYYSTVLCHHFPGAHILVITSSPQAGWFKVKRWQRLLK